MSAYRDHALPRIQDRIMRRPANEAIRARVCRQLSGHVLEVGFGTGLNVRHYPAAVTGVIAIEPSALCGRIAGPRVATSPTPISHAGLTGERLDLPEHHVDAILSTWTLCTIPDLDAALAEMRRVLRPAGSLHFVEHGHSPDERIARWQRRLEPANKRLAGGCHLSRDIPAILERSGFRLTSLDTYYADREPKPMGYTFEGTAR